jgi:hypothetical protein
MNMRTLAVYFTQYVEADPRPVKADVVHGNRRNRGNHTSVLENIKDTCW